jgi:hypothetical protein
VRHHHTLDSRLTAAQNTGPEPLVAADSAERIDTYALVALNAQNDDPEAAAVIYSAADTLAPEFVLAPHVVEARQQADSTLQASFGVKRPGELRAQGMAMDEDDAIAYAHAAINQCLGQEPP